MRNLKNKIIYILSAILIIGQISLPSFNIVNASSETLVEDNIDIKENSELLKLKEEIESSLSELEKSEKENEEIRSKLEELFNKYLDEINLIENSDEKSEEEKYLQNKKEKFQSILKEQENSEENATEDIDEELNKEILKLFNNLEERLIDLESKLKEEMQENKSKSRVLSIDEKNAEDEKISIEKDLNKLEEKISELKSSENKENWMGKYNDLMTKFNSLELLKVSPTTWLDVQPLIDAGETEIDISNLPFNATGTILKISGKSIKIFSNNKDKEYENLQIQLEKDGELEIEDLKIINTNMSQIKVLDNSDNILKLTGENYFSTKEKYAAISVNNNLESNPDTSISILGDGSLKIGDKYENFKQGAAGIGGDYGYGSGNITIGLNKSSPKITINQVKGAAGIGAGENQDTKDNANISIIGNAEIYINMDKNPANNTNGAAIGGSYNQSAKSFESGSSGNIKILENAKVDANIYGYVSAAIGQGFNTKPGKILIEGGVEIKAFANGKYNSNDINNLVKDINYNSTPMDELSGGPAIGFGVLNLEYQGNGEGEVVVRSTSDGRPNLILFGAGGINVGGSDTLSNKDHININGADLKIVSVLYPGIGGSTNIDSDFDNVSILQKETKERHSNIKLKDVNVELKDLADNNNNRRAAGIGAYLNNKNSSVNIDIEGSKISGETYWGALVGISSSHNPGIVNIDINNSDIYGETYAGAIIGPGGTSAISAITPEEYKFKELTDNMNINIKNSKISGKTEKGAGIGSASDSYYKISDKRININIENTEENKDNIINIKSLQGTGIGIGAYSNAPMNINIKNGNLDLESNLGAALGTGLYSGYSYGNEIPLSISIEDSDVKTLSNQGAGIGTGYGAVLNKLYDLNLKNSIVDSYSFVGAGIGAGQYTNNRKYLSTSGNILIDGGNIKSRSTWGSGIGGSGLLYDDSTRILLNEGTLKVINGANIEAYSRGLNTNSDGSTLETRDAITAKLLDGSDNIMISHTFVKEVPNTIPFEISIYNQSAEKIKTLKLEKEKNFTNSTWSDLETYPKSYAYTTNNNEKIYLEKLSYEDNGENIVKQIVQAEPLREKDRHPINVKEFNSVNKYEGKSQDIINDNTFVIFQNIEKFEFIFDANTGTFEDGTNINKLIVDDGEKLTNNDIKIPKKDGYEFIGWTKEKNGSGHIYTLEEILNIKINEDKYVYAQWKKIDNSEIIEVIFDGNGGKVEGQDKLTKHYKDNEKVLEPETPIRKGYEFKYWSTDKSGNNRYVFGQSEDKDLILYAQWEKESSGGNGGSHRPKPSKDESKEFVRPLVEEDLLLHKEYLYGYPDNTVRAVGSITREEASAILDRITEDKSMTKRLYNYPDVEKNRWSYNNIENLSNKGGIKGYPDGKFKPVNKITRAEAATILVRLENETGSNKNIPQEIKNHWAKEEINIAIEKGWIKGYEDGSIKADSYITRAEFVALVNRMQNRKVKEENILENIEYFKDLEKSAWYYEDIVEATNTHKYKEKRLEDGSEKWTEIIK